MTPLPTVDGGFRVISADPPWSFKSNSKANPGRNAMRHYACMTLKEITELPVADIAAKDCLLALWITGPFLAIGAHIPIMKAWGFKPSGMGFDWLKLQRNVDIEGYVRVGDFDKLLHMGGGFTTRKNCEYVVFGKRGRSVRRDAGVRSTIISNLREHSRKPDEFYSSIEAYADGPYLDMFSRERRWGWSSFGNEKTKFDEEVEISMRLAA